MNKLVFAALFGAVSLFGASCTPDEPPPPVVTEVGALNVVVDGSTATITLSGVSGSLRSLQTAVSVAGGTASAVDGFSHDLVEAGLETGDGAKSSFTVVVADTRRLPVNNGPVARLTISDGATVTLSNAVAVDAAGTKRTLRTGTN